MAKKEPAIPGGKPKALSLVRVNVTGQPYDYFRPWQKKASFSKRGLGAVLSQGRVLVTADLVANQNYVELERAESGEKLALRRRLQAQVETSALSDYSGPPKREIVPDELPVVKQPRLRTDTRDVQPIEPLLPTQ